MLSSRRFLWYNFLSSLIVLSSFTLPAKSFGGPDVRIRSGGSASPHWPTQHKIDHDRRFFEFRSSSQKRSGSSSAAGADSKDHGSAAVDLAEMFFPGLFPDEATKIWYSQLGSHQRYNILRELYHDAKAGKQYHYRISADGRQIQKLTTADLEMERLAQEREQRLAQEREQQRLAQEREQQRLAQEREQRLAQEREQQHVIQEHPGSPHIPPTDGNHLFTVLEAVGRGEDPISQGIERMTEGLVRISYKHFPEGTETILNLLGCVDTAINAAIEFVDDHTGNRASAVWQELDESTQARILGAGKLLSVLVPVGRIKGLTELGKLPWTSWKHYKKVTVDGREYAQIGDRLYTHHAVDRMQPRALGTPAGGDEGRSFPPSLVDDVIRRGTKRQEIRDGVERTVHCLGFAEVVTEQGGRIVITVNPKLKKK